MSDYLSSLGYPFRGRPMVFVFSVMMVWGVFLAARDVLIGWIAAFCFLLPFMCAFFMKMVRQSAMGEEDICPFPELDEWLDSLMLPFVRLVVCIIVSSCLSPCMRILRPGRRILPWRGCSWRRV